MYVQNHVVAIEDLLKVRTDEDKVDAAKAELGYADEDVDSRLHGFGPSLEPWWTLFKAETNSFRKIRRTAFVLLIVVHLFGTVQQYVLTVDTHEAYEQGQYRCHYKPTVLERIAHSKASGSDVALKHVDHRFRVGRFVMGLDTVRRDNILRVIMSWFLPNVVMVQVVVMVVSVVWSVVMFCAIRSRCRLAIEIFQYETVVDGAAVGSFRPVASSIRLMIVYRDIDGHLRKEALI